MENISRLETETEILEVALAAELDQYSGGCSIARLSLYVDRARGRWVIMRESFCPFVDSPPAKREVKVYKAASEVVQYLGLSVAAKELFLEIRDSRDREMFLRAYREAAQSICY